MNISDIYTKYQVNKGLREHMIRVASVAQQICEQSTVVLDTRNIVSACLLHDLGNLIKAKMDSMPELYEPEGVLYWSEVQSQMKEKYGEDEHQATVAMVHEINPGTDTVFYFNAIGSDDTKRVYETGTLGEKIATYSDMRVGPHGIVTLEQRMNDLRARYLTRNKPGFSADEIDDRQRMLQDMENEIFSSSNILASDIDDTSTKILQEKLLTWEI